jgi:predicted RNA-binding protein associated with RNAse of E/G family
MIQDTINPRHAGPRRYFWLLDEGVQLIYEPFGWRAEWYVDVVDIQRGAAGPEHYEITDWFIDVVVEGMGPTYRMLDLHELGEAHEVGLLDARQTRAALTRAQNFVEKYLHRGARFPPAPIAPLFSADHNYPQLDTGSAP